eukprot:Hpha_TRINITY_DN6757_c0_g1::TRINITY_DN6757_c0_g1_i1::g.110899::m.110899
MQNTPPRPLIPSISHNSALSALVPAPPASPSAAARRLAPRASMSSSTSTQGAHWRASANALRIRPSVSPIQGPNSSAQRTMRKLRSPLSAPASASQSADLPHPVGPTRSTPLGLSPQAATTPMSTPRKAPKKVSKTGTASPQPAKSPISRFLAPSRSACRGDHAPSRNARACLRTSPTAAPCVLAAMRRAASGDRPSSSARRARCLASGGGCCGSSPARSNDCRAAGRLACVASLAATTSTTRVSSLAEAIRCSSATNTAPQSSAHACAQRSAISGTTNIAGARNGTCSSLCRRTTKVGCFHATTALVTVSSAPAPQTTRSLRPPAGLSACNRCSNWAAAGQSGSSIAATPLPSPTRGQ